MAPSTLARSIRTRSVEDVTGNVKVSQEKGSVKIEQITGDVHVEGRVNEVSVADVKGSVQLDGEFQESVKLARIDEVGNLQVFAH